MRDTLSPNFPPGTVVSVNTGVRTWTRGVILKRLPNNRFIVGFGYPDEREFPLSKIRLFNPPKS